MRAVVLRVWRTNHVIAGLDPWDVVDEAWISMAQNSFASEGPFLPHALTVVRNKAVDALRRGETKRAHRSIDAPLAQEVTGSPGADIDYFKNEEQVTAIQRLALVEEGIYSDDILSDLERKAFIAVQLNRKSRAAVGRELEPPLTGQRVGQIVAVAMIKLQSYVKSNEGGGAHGR